jgi:pyruvate formate lyase activating enzyme
MHGLPEFMAKVRDLGYKIKLDTNGTRPNVLRDIIDRELVDYVAMDIKNSRSRYGETVGFDSSYDLAPIDESIAILREGKVDFEFRTTVSKTFHSHANIFAMGEWLAGDEKFFLQQFKDSGDLIGEKIEPYDEEEMKTLLDLIRRFVPNAQLRGV